MRGDKLIIGICVAIGLVGIFSSPEQRISDRWDHQISCEDGASTIVKGIAFGFRHGGHVLVVCPSGRTRIDGTGFHLLDGDRPSKDATKT
jgi:hypothetical protein